MQYVEADEGNTSDVPLTLLARRFLQPMALPAMVILESQSQSKHQNLFLLCLSKLGRAESIWSLTSFQQFIPAWPMRLSR